MGAPTSLLGNARAFARDYPRDQMPQGYLWDVVDFVPSIVDTTLTSRAGWESGSNTLPGDVESGINARFPDGDQLLVQDATGQLSRVDPQTGAVTARGAVPRSLQNPVQLFEDVIFFDRDAAVVPVRFTSTAGPLPLDATAPRARVGTVWRDTLASDGGPGKEDTVVFGVPGQPAAAYDSASFQGTGGKITGLASVRSVLLVFHAGFTERIRGQTIPTLAGDLKGDLAIDQLFGQVGCGDPRSIAYWNDNVIFADQHGVHVTDGATVRNIVSQGGISSYWHGLWANATSVAATVFFDFYVVTLSSGSFPVTLICDLTRRQWFRFSNINARCYISSAGGTGAEQIWAGVIGISRLGNITPCFFGGLSSDYGGQRVLPVMETPWYRLSDEGRKRIRFLYLSYDGRVVSGGGFMAGAGVGYIRSPSDKGYTDVGSFSFDTEASPRYKRHRIPIGQEIYGMAFRVEAFGDPSFIRIYDLAVEAHPLERSSV